MAGAASLATKDLRDIRIVTLNLWGTQAPVDARLALAVEQLRALSPDVICLQEVKGYQGGTTASWIARQLAMTPVVAVTHPPVLGAPPALTPQPRNEAFAAVEDEGLAILTRWPIVSTQFAPLPHSRPTEGRGLLSIALQLPTAHASPELTAPIWVHTTHLHYRLDDGIAREAQVQFLDTWIRQRGRQNDSAPQVLCGDFNATPDSDEMRFLRGLTTLPRVGSGVRTHFQDAWLRLHREPHSSDGPAAGITWSSENELTRPLRSLDIDRRIDYIYVTSRKRDGRATVRQCQVVLTDAVPSDEHGQICASDHFGVLADVQVVPNA